MNIHVKDNKVVMNNNFSLTNPTGAIDTIPDGYKPINMAFRVDLDLQFKWTTCQSNKGGSRCDVVKSQTVFDIGSWQTSFIVDPTTYCQECMIFPLAGHDAQSLVTPTSSSVSPSDLWLYGDLGDDAQCAVVVSPCMSYMASLNSYACFTIPGIPDYEEMTSNISYAGGLRVNVFPSQFGYVAKLPLAGQDSNTSQYYAYIPDTITCNNGTSAASIVSTNVWSSPATNNQPVSQVEDQCGTIYPWGPTFYAGGNGRTVVDPVTGYLCGGGMYYGTSTFEGGEPGINGGEVQGAMNGLKVALDGIAPVTFTINANNSDCNCADGLAAWYEGTITLTPICDECTSPRSGTQAVQLSPNVVGYIGELPKCVSCDGSSTGTGTSGSSSMSSGSSSGSMSSSGSGGSSSGSTGSSSGSTSNSSSHSTSSSSSNSSSSGSTGSSSGSTSNSSSHSTSSSSSNSSSSGSTGSSSGSTSNSSSHSTSSSSSNSSSSNSNSASSGSEGSSSYSGVGSGSSTDGSTSTSSSGSSTYTACGLCDSEVTCAYCPDCTPTTLEIQFYNVIMYGACLSCSSSGSSGSSSSSSSPVYTIMSSTINYGITGAAYTLTQVSACTWQWTGDDASNTVRIGRNADGDCYGTYTDVTGTATVTATLTSAGMEVTYTNALTTGETVTLFSGLTASGSCGRPSFVISTTLVAACSGSTIDLGHQGYALVIPCASTVAAPTCLYNTGQSINSDGITTGSGSPCDVDAAWTLNGGIASAAATPWNIYIPNNGPNNRWISANCVGNGLTEFNAFATSFSIPSGTDLSTFALSGNSGADNWVDSISVNGTAIDIGNFTTTGSLYGTTTGYTSVQAWATANSTTPNQTEYESTNPFTIPAGSAFVIGNNTITFNVNEQNADDTQGGLIVIWDEPCSPESVRKPEKLRKPEKQCLPCRRREGET